MGIKLDEVFIVYIFFVYYKEYDSKILLYY